MPVEAPTKPAVKTPEKTEPDINPDRRLNPDRLCPAQKDDLVRKIRTVEP